MITGLEHLLPQLVLGEFGRGQVAQVLIDPVAHVGGADPLRPPRLGLVVAAPGGRGVPVVVHVVVVEDHRGGDDGQQPAHRGLGPGFPVEEAVLAEVRDLVAGRFGRVAVLLDELARGRPRVVGVDLVADQQHQVGPPLVRRPAQVQGVGDQRVRAVFLLVPLRAAGAEPARQDRQFGDPAGTEGEPERPARVRRPEHARRELRVRLGPADGPVQGDLVLVLGPGAQIADHHQRVVVPGDLEGPRLVPEDLHFAGPFGLDPDRGLGLPDVTQQRAQCEQGCSLCHGCYLPGAGLLMTKPMLTASAATRTAMQIPAATLYPPSAGNRCPAGVDSTSTVALSALAMA